MGRKKKIASIPKIVYSLLGVIVTCLKIKNFTIIVYKLSKIIPNISYWVLEFRETNGILQHKFYYGFYIIYSFMFYLSCSYSVISCNESIE